MTFLICLIAVTATLVQASKEKCDSQSVADVLKLMNATYKKEPTLRFEEVLNKGMKEVSFYYRVRAAKAVTCRINNHRTTLVIATLGKTNCEKTQMRSYGESGRNCEFAGSDETVDCAWSGIEEGSLFTHGFWCVNSTKKSYSYPIPTRLCQSWRYEDSAAFRLPVPEEFRPWKTNMLAYLPPICHVRARSGQVECAKFNNENIDMFDEEPSDEYRHTDGRTGIRGRGLYSQLGKNKFMQFVILRHSDGLGHTVVERLPMNSGQLLLPLISADYVSAVKHQFLSLTNNSFCEQQQWSACLKKLVRVYNGDMWDGRNTDNAWMHLHSYLLLNAPMVADQGESYDYVWKDLDDVDEEKFKYVVQKTLPTELAEKVLAQTDNAEIKLAMLLKHGIVKAAINLGNCVSSLHPLVPMGLPVADFFGIMALSVFYFV
uniref:Uncharacterized protein n=1 Tax=Trichuris muris TaxID=70415 RepID=A0A5S6QLZ3_TRIMR